jgi:dolichol-phosphate mannosyltransferase
VVIEWIPEADVNGAVGERNLSAEPAELRMQSGESPTLTVIIPVYNEEATIDELLRRVFAAPYDKQVIVVDDGSTDGTATMLEKWKGYPQLEVLRQDRNRGKGAAIRSGLGRARGRFTCIQDADLEYNPHDYPRMLEPLIDGKAIVVYGSRYLSSSGRGRFTWNPFRFGVAVINFCVRVLYGAQLTDEATCYKALPTAVLRGMDLRCERFEFCPEVTAKACRLGLAIHEVQRASQ